MGAYTITQHLLSIFLNFTSVYSSSVLRLSTHGSKRQQQLSLHELKPENEWGPLSCSSQQVSHGASLILTGHILNILQCSEEWNPGILYEDGYSHPSPIEFRPRLWSEPKGIWHTRAECAGHGSTEQNGVTTRRKGPRHKIQHIFSAIP